MPCCRRPTQEAKLYVLNGSGTETVAEGLAKEMKGVTNFHGDMEYLPGEETPLGITALEPTHKVSKVVAAAAKHASEGYPSVLTTDAWGNHAANIAHAIHSSADPDLKSVYAFVHTPLRHVAARAANNTQQLIRALTDYGVLYKGVPNKVPGSVGFLPMSDVNKSLSLIGKAKDNTMGTSDLEAVRRLARRHLEDSLNLGSNPAGVYLVPSGHYDLVLDGTRPQRATSALKSHTGTNSVLRKEILGSNFVVNASYPRFCKPCMTSEHQSDMICGSCNKYISMLLKQRESE